MASPRGLLGRALPGAAWRGRRVSRGDPQGPRGPGLNGIVQVWFPEVRAAGVRPGSAGGQLKVCIKLVESIGLGLRGDIVNSIKAAVLPRNER